MQSQVLPLSEGALRAEVVPALGGSVAGFWSLDTPDLGGPDKRRCDWLRPASAEAMARGKVLGVASFPLVPFCNRLRDGRASFEGREIRMPPNHPGQPSPHPLHGLGWQRPWQVLESDAVHVALGLEVAADAAWPWAFSARQEIRLTEDSLHLHLSITNREPEAAMPVGLGFHPYFPRRSGTRLTAPCAAVWRTDAAVMPIAVETGESVDRLRAGMDLDEEAFDNNFAGWERVARIDWPADTSGPRRHLVMEAEAGLDYFVLYNPVGLDHFCAEPVSQCTDWLNLAGRYGRGSLGGARLAAGESMAVSCRFTPAWGA